MIALFSESEETSLDNLARNELAMNLLHYIKLNSQVMLKNCPVQSLTMHSKEWGGGRGGGEIVGALRARPQCMPQSAPSL